MSVLIDNSATESSKTKPLNLAIGAQNGAMRDPHQWTSAAPYVRQKVIAVLIAAPAAFEYMDGGKTALVAALKSLIEMMPQTIEGLNSSVTWEFAEVATGHAGEMMESPTKGSRARSVPSFTWSEKYGFAVTNFFTKYGTQLLIDPDLGVPGIVASEAYIAAGRPPILPEQQSMTVLFIEPDVSMTYVTKAWLCANMMPKTGGIIDGKRDVTMGGEVLSVTIEFTALTLTGKTVDKMAKNYLDSLSIKDLKPLNLKPYFDAATADVNAAQDDYAHQIVNAVQNP